LVEVRSTATWTPSIEDSCVRTIMAPMPHENPVTTACGTFKMYCPSWSTQKLIINTEATRQTCAAPPTPWCATARAINGTVALAVPPIRTGLRPSSAVTGAVTIDVTIPSVGGSPIMDARASPYGRAIRAAINPPETSPPKARHE